MGVMKAQALEAKQRNSKWKKVKPFGAVEISTVDSPQWQELTKMAALTYVMVKTFYRGERKPFKAPFEALKRRTRIKHGATLSRALCELEQKTWITAVRYAKHRKGRGLRVKANEYELTGLYDPIRW